MKKLLIGGLLAAAASAAQAETWRVDLLIFQHVGDAPVEQGLPAQPLGDAAGIPINDSARLRANGIRMLPPERSRLSSHWQRLDNAGRFEPLLRLSWLQENPPTRDGTTLLLREGAPLIPLRGEDTHPLEGRLRLTQRRYLHLQAELRLSERNPDDGKLYSWRLEETRRMRSATLHYLDSERLGALVRIDKAGGGG